jgi:hypothetical protein
MTTRHVLAASIAALSLLLLAGCSGHAQDLSATDGEAGTGADDGGDAAACATQAATFPCGNASCAVGTELCSIIEYDCPQLCPDSGAVGGFRYQYGCRPAPSSCGTCAACGCVLEAGACPYPDGCTCHGEPGAVTTNSSAY